jgi:tetratricopeptide (TPR) repeat protein
LRIASGQAGRCPPTHPPTAPLDLPFLILLTARVRSLFPRVDPLEIASFAFPADLDRRHDVVLGFVDALKQGRLDDTKEVSLHGEFLLGIFRDALGYRIKTQKGAESWELEEERRMGTGGKSVDGALGFFRQGEPGHVIVPIEPYSTRRHSRSLLKTARNAARKRGDGVREVHCILSHGYRALHRSRHEEADRLCLEALPLCRSDVLSRTECYKNLGINALRQSKLGEARNMIGEALSLYTRMGYVLGRANCIVLFGDIALRDRKYNEARQRYHEARLLYCQVGELYGQANCIKGLGDVALHGSNYDEAFRQYNQALSLFREVGDLLGEANCITKLGILALCRSDYEDAGRHFDTALHLFRQIGDVQGQANCHQGLGHTMRQSAPKQARRQYASALRLYERVPDHRSAALAHYLLATVATDDAEEQEHVAIARALGIRYGYRDLIAKLDTEFVPSLASGALRVREEHSG